MISNLFLDLLPAFVPFAIQAIKSDGTIIDPTNLTNAVNLYEEDGLDGTFVNTIKAQFTPVKINSKTGFYGVLSPKSNLDAGKFYMLRWNPTVNSIDTGSKEIYFIMNSSSFKANVSGLAPANEYDTEIDRIDTNTISIKGSVENVTFGLSALKDLLDAIDTSTELAARFTEIKGAGWTTETLKAIKDAVDAISIENFSVL